MHRDDLRQNRSRQLIEDFLDRFLDQHRWWGARSAWRTDDGMLLDPWRVSPHAPPGLQGLGHRPGPAELVDPGPTRFREPTLVPIEDIECTRAVAADLATAGVVELVVVDVAGSADVDLRFLLAAPPDRSDTTAGLEALRTGAQLLPTVLRQEAERGELRLGALRDPLTGLLNRAGLDELASLVTPGPDVRAVLYLDLDGFKAVNDAHGHAAGDTLLLDTAQRLANQVRPTDLVARVGGDEFIVVATSVIDEESVVLLSQRLVGALAHDTIVGTGAVVSVVASAGVALWGADTAFGDAVSSADALMYEAKRIGGGIAMQDAAGRILVRDPHGQAATAEEIEHGRAPLRIDEIVELPGGGPWAVHVLLQGELSSVPTGEMMRLVDDALLGKGILARPHRVVVQPRGRGWSREGVLLEAVELFRARFPSSELLVMIDAHASTTELRLIAEEVRARLEIELVLGGVGAATGGDLRTIAQTAPVVIALDREAVLNLDRTQPRGIASTLAAAMASAIGARLLVIDPPEGVDAARLAAWGCTLAVMPHDSRTRLERSP